MDSEDRLNYEVTVCELLSLLTQSDVMPEGKETFTSSFDVDEIDLSLPGRWIPCVESVEGWLNLDAPLKLGSPDLAINSLESALGIAISNTSGNELFSDDLLEAFHARLQMAEGCRQLFIEILDDGEASLNEASKAWLQAWEESDGEDFGDGPVSATTEEWRLRDFASLVRSNKFDLNPSFQRSDVWPTGDAQMLIESVLRGIPLPSIIVLRPKDMDVTQVVDGKQRITALLRFTGDHPEALRIVEEKNTQFPEAEFLKNFREDYPKFRRHWKKYVGEPLTATLESKYYFPFKLRKGENCALKNGLERLQGKYFTEILEEKITISGEIQTVNFLFREITPYKIPLIRYNEATPKQIHNVFELYNRQGKKLNAEEIRNAVYHHLDLSKALLVVSGDNSDVGTVAPFLESEWETLQSVGGNLSDYEFGTARFKRSKVLAWVAAHLVAEPDFYLSTARLINFMLEDTANRPESSLRNKTAVTDLMMLLSSAIDIHSAHAEAWHGKFRHSKGADKWQELQLVATLVGTAIAHVEHGEKLDGIFESRSDEIRQLTSSWKRPKKTQTDTQWVAIAQWSTELARFLGADLDKCHQKVQKRFGSSGIQLLVEKALSE